MKTSLLEILACPVCQNSLQFEGTMSTDRFVKGNLHCVARHFYQVKDEIPVLKDPQISTNGFVWKVKFPNIEKYDTMRKQYASYLSEEQRKADKELMQAVVQNVSKEGLILDVASGMGRLLSVLSQHLGKKVNLLGTDIDETPLRGAKLKLAQQRSYTQTSLSVMDGKHLAFKPQKICSVTSFFGLDNIPEPKKAFQEVYRVLRPEGRLVLATLWLKEGSKSLAMAQKLDYGGIPTKNRLTRMLETTGFELDSTEIFYSGEWPHNPMDQLPLEGDWFAHSFVLAHKK
ncbi:MAG: class I SAM-dependent methyltransferase [Candidatus Bathyarchaeota archaeon]|nr:class I SAM-dependent methyltransferase [Candidatus Bathyarchaeota archaeon]MDH5732691.1 class I SAM-dependent methyltransferase [Candidatus Bathyarchaeota archaeon]